MLWLPAILLSAFGWSLVNVLNSSLVQRYERHPVTLMWSQASFGLVSMCILFFVRDIRSDWWLLLLLMGVCTYAADLVFFWVLNTIEVSVANAAWVILSLFLSIAGFVLFGESWTATQAAGAAFICVGVLYLSLRNPTNGSLANTFGMLTLLALLYVPNYVVRKNALVHGETVAAVFFWLIIGRESVAFLFPLLVSEYRARVVRLVRTVRPAYFWWCLCIVGCFLFGEYTNALAYALGPISLVAIAGNVQPFIVMLLAYALLRFAPYFAPKEVVTPQSVRVKLISFTVAFVGLALLSLPK